MFVNFTALQLIISEKSSRNQLIHTRLYHTIYRCIVIHKWQYIDTSKLCIVASLLRIKFKMSYYEYNGTQVFLLGTVMKRVCRKGGHGTHVANQLDYAELILA